MTEQYILRRRRNGRFSKKGYVFNDERWIKRLSDRFTSWGHKLFWLGMLIGLTIGIII